MLSEIESGKKCKEARDKIIEFSAGQIRNIYEAKCDSSEVFGFLMSTAERMVTLLLVTALNTTCFPFDEDAHKKLLTEFFNACEKNIIEVKKEMPNLMEISHKVKTMLEEEMAKIKSSSSSGLH